MAFSRGGGLLEDLRKSVWTGECIEECMEKYMEEKREPYIE